MSRKTPGIKDYTVGWICAIYPEYLAATLCLEETHSPLAYPLSPNNPNAYVLGKISGHNVVIACLPQGSYGTTSSLITAMKMLQSFPNIRIRLMVGIGGGAPTRENDIRLGDVVVSFPGNGNGGILHYDVGTRIQGQDFVSRKFLDGPPTILRDAAMDLQTMYGQHRASLEKSIDDVLEMADREVQQDLRRPNVDTDLLFQSNFVHPVHERTTSCWQSCARDPRNLVPRTERRRPREPAVHYGLIASGNKLVKDAVYRDRLAERYKVLCFEMEAAGLMEEFPCLVIRGICDYADTHKNKAWQPYSALAAAAYAKDLLSIIPP